MVEQWFSGATRFDGPHDKHGYPGTPEPLPKLGVLFHSMEGSMNAGLGELAKPTRRASWTFSNGKKGELLQHFPMDWHVWANGSKESNIKFVAVEHEGKAGEPLTPEQIDNDVELLVWLYQQNQWEKLMRQVTLWEHREMGRFGSPPTACPSDRIPWVRITARAEEILAEPDEEDEDMKPYVAWDRDRQRVYLVGPWGASWITDAKDVKKFEELYGTMEVGFSSATLDSLNQKRTIPA